MKCLFVLAALISLACAVPPYGVAPGYGYGYAVPTYGYAPLAYGAPVAKYVIS